MVKGKFLGAGHALRQYNRFKAENDHSKFSLGVCYSLKELQDFIDAANIMFDKMTNTPPPEQRGVALTMGVHTKESASEDPSYADDKITIMMVASRWRDDTQTMGRAESCDNHVLNPRPPQTEEEEKKELEEVGIADVAYDAGSLFP